MDQILVGTYNIRGGGGGGKLISCDTTTTNRTANFSCAAEESDITHEVKDSIFKERKPQQSLYSREGIGYTIVASSGWFEKKKIYRILVKL